MGKRTVYVCCSLKPNNYEYVSRILANYESDYTFLRPQPGQLQNKLNYVELDVAMIKHADELWVVGKYGRDCSWEIGYATALKKIIRIFVDESNKNLIQEDWMLYHGKNIDLLVFVDIWDEISKRRS